MMRIQNRPNRSGRWGPAIRILSGVSLMAVAVFFLLPDVNLSVVLQCLRELGILPFYLGLTFLPLIGVPSSPFYILAGAAFPFWQNVLFSCISIPLHFAMAYWIARKFLRGFILRLLKRSRFSLPEIRPDNRVRVALLVKLAPGLPLFLKSYSLGVMEIGFPIYITVSSLTTFVFATGFLLLGNSLTRSAWGIVLAVAAAGIFLYVAFRLLKEKE